MVNMVLYIQIQLNPTIMLLKITLWFFCQFQPRSPHKSKSDDVVDQPRGSPSEAGGFLKVAKDNGNGSRCSTPTEVNSPFSLRNDTEPTKVEKTCHNPILCGMVIIP